MKVFVGLLILAGGLFLVLHYTGMFEFDPVKQAQDARAAIKVGMSWDKVVSAAQEPRKYCVYVLKKEVVNGQEFETVKAGPEMPFDAENIRKRVADGSFEAGFSFRYVFSAGDAFEVKFDEMGYVESVQDMRTMKDLLDM